MSIGFIGTGAICEAMVTGLVRHGVLQRDILVSPRNQERASGLESRFEQVSIATNEAIVEQAETVVLALLPPDATRVLEPLEFRGGQTVISLIAELSLEDLGALAEPATDIHRAIPMPPIEFGVGPAVVYPSSPEVLALFGSVSTVVVPDSEEEFDVFTAASSTMASFFDLVASIARWMEDRGVADEAATTYVTALFRALTAMADGADPATLEALRRDCQTAGGLNEQVFDGCARAGWTDILATELDGIMTRLRATRASPAPVT